MSEAARILLELFKLGRSPEALMARAAMAEQRGLQLEAKGKRFIRTNPRKAQRLFNRSAWWQDHATVLKQRSIDRGAVC